MKDINNISIVKDLEINNKIKQLEAKNPDEFELLQEELRIITLKIEKEIDLRRQTKKKIDDIEELKEEAKEFKSVKMLQDLNYEKNDEIFQIAKIELKLEKSRISKKSINIFKKSIKINNNTANFYTCC